MEGAWNPRRTILVLPKLCPLEVTNVCSATRAEHTIAKAAGLDMLLCPPHPLLHKHS